MKKIIYYLIYLLLLFLINAIPISAKEIETCTRDENNFKNAPHDVILETPCVDANLKVYDFASLLTDEEEEILIEKVLEFKVKTNYELVLVTTSDNPKGSAMEYADDFYDYNDFGSGTRRDGILLLIDMQTREYYISTTGYAIKMYDDNRIDAILDASEYSMKNGNYYNAFLEMLKSLNNFYDMGVPESNQNLVIDEYGNSYYIRHIPYLLIFLIASVVTLIVSLILYYMTRLKIKAIDAVSYLKNEKITLEKDRFINTVVTHVPIASSTSSGSGSGGSSSFHSSSSGSSHGGGGRGF